jgi:hypothetical protein
VIVAICSSAFADVMMNSPIVVNSVRIVRRMDLFPL